MRKDNRAFLQAAYAQANQNFRKLTDIRFKLLTLLPLGTGLVKVSGVTREHPSLALLGAGVTIALWVYDERNNQHYDELVGQLGHLERQLGLPGGPFDARPRAWWRLGLAVGGRAGHSARSSSDTSSDMAPFVEHRWPIMLVYGMSLVIWVGQLLASIVTTELGQNPYLTLSSWLVATSIIWFVAVLVQSSRDVQKRQLNDSVVSAHHELKQALATAREVNRELVRACCKGGRFSEKRLRHHMELARGALVAAGYETPFDPPAQVPQLISGLAAQVLAAASDLPPRWIEDVTGRRSSQSMFPEHVEPPRRPPRAPSLLLAFALLALASFCLALGIVGPREEAPEAKPTVSAEAIESLTHEEATEGAGAHRWIVTAEPVPSLSVKRHTGTLPVREAQPLALYVACFGGLCSLLGMLAAGSASVGPYGYVTALFVGGVGSLALALALPVLPDWLNLLVYALAASDPRR
ncbi:MAG TPA: hypothetical protein VFV94_12260 [Polyangiaceae bacterium]|nr:hypothetical protein [Polyangiaceae bacterium]